MQRYRRILFAGILIIALGVLLNTTLKTGEAGTVLIAIGGLFFIFGMQQKRKEEDVINKNKEQK